MSEAGWRPQILKGRWMRLTGLFGAAAAILMAGELQGTSDRGRAAFVLCAAARQQNCVVDGDTIRYDGMAIRLMDIDAPETHRPKCSYEAALGERATRRLLELMNQGPFEMVRSRRDVDRYGRKLRSIERNGRSVGETLIAEGLARPWAGARRSWCA